MPDSRSLTPNSANPFSYKMFKQISPMGDYKDYLQWFDDQAKALALQEYYKTLMPEQPDHSAADWHETDSDRQKYDRPIE
jgi:hypothetical protein